MTTRRPDQPRRIDLVDMVVRAASCPDDLSDLEPLLRGVLDLLDTMERLPFLDPTERRQARQEVDAAMRRFLPTIEGGCDQARAAMAATQEQGSAVARLIADDWSNETCVTAAASLLTLTRSATARVAAAWIGERLTAMERIETTAAWSTEARRVARAWVAVAHAMLSADDQQAAHDHLRNTVDALLRIIEAALTRRGGAVVSDREG